LSKKHLGDGSDVNAQNESGTTPLGWAVYYGYKELIELLIAEGADVNANSNGRTPLHCAVLTDRLEATELLIEKGANVNAGSEAGVTPLYMTALYGHAESANLLRKRGGKTGEELKAQGK
jgi:ankyrin repeat protein